MISSCGPEYASFEAEFEITYKDRHTSHKYIKISAAEAFVIINIRFVILIPTE